MLRIVGVISLFIATIGIITTIIFSSIFTGKDMPHNWQLWFGFILALVVIGAFGIYLGKSVSDHKEWARVPGLILAVFLTLGFPIGTLIGIYIIFCLTINWKNNVEIQSKDHNLIERKKNKVEMFATIDSKDDDLMVVKKSSVVIMSVAAFQIGLGRLHYLFNLSIIIDPSLIFEALLCALLVGIMLKWKSRIAAGLILLLALFELLMSCLYVTFWGPYWKVSNMPFAMIIVIFAYRAVKSTFNLHHKTA